MQVYLTGEEVMALISSATEWCEIMGNGDKDSCDCVEERMENGLGSALYKLYKGRNGQKTYEEYAKKNIRR